MRELSIVREISVGVLSELASKSWDRSELGEHADKKSDSNFPHDAKPQNLIHYLLENR